LRKVCEENVVLYVRVPRRAAWFAEFRPVSKPDGKHPFLEMYEIEIEKALDR